MPHSERVAGSHALYLHLEETGLAMHSGGLAIFDAKPFTRDDGAVDIERIQPVLEQFLVTLPHARQRLRYVPFEQHPVWIDDDRFQLAYHIRHTRLPRPGTVRQLKRLCGRLMSESLDRHKPLWEAWIIEGLEGARIAIMVKVHPGVLEPVRLPELFARIGEYAASKQRGTHSAFRPRKAPAPAQMMADSLVHWAGEARAAFETSQTALRSPLDSLRALADNTGAIGRAVTDMVRVARQPMLNPRSIGAHRRVETLHLPEREVASVAERLGVEILDVCLAALGGGLGRFLTHHAEKAEGDALHLLISLPSAPAHGDGPATPRSLRLMLPIGEMPPPRRAGEVARAHADARSAPELAGFELLERMEQRTPAIVQRAVAYAAARRGTANLIVHFVEGSRKPIPVLETTVQSVTSFAPLFVDQALCVSIVRACGLLSWGLTSDWDLLPELHELVEAIDTAYVELRDAALRDAPAAVGPASEQGRTA